MEKIKKIFQHLSIINFIEYYTVFEKYKNSSSNKEIIEAFRQKPEKWTEKSSATRASNGKSIFKNNMEIDALRYIMNSANSNKVSKEIIEKAYHIYSERKDIPKVSSQEGTGLYTTEQMLIDAEIRLIESNNLLNREEKLALIKIRLGQSSYRSNLINMLGDCSITGCKNVNLLIASHIKPYKDCDTSEKYDKFNGLLLTPNYDKLFDRFLISFDEIGNILISHLLSVNDLKNLNISINDRIINLQKEHLKYLKYHRLLYEKLNIDIS